MSAVLILVIQYHLNEYFLITCFTSLMKTNLITILFSANCEYFKFGITNYRT